MADIRVIVYYVPRSPIATSYTLYFNQVPPSGPLPPQPETNTHFVGRHRPIPFTVLTSLRQTPNQPSGPLPLQPETNVHFIPRHRAPAHTVFSMLRQAPAIDVPFAVVTEAQPHFVGKFTSPVFARQPISTTNSDVPVPPLVVNDTPSGMVIFRPTDGDWQW